MKKGFTLIELMAVVILLGVIGVIIIPIVSSIVKENKNKLYNEQIEEIKLDTEKWMYQNIDLLPNNEGETITLTLLELKKAGCIALDVRNPKTDELFPNDMMITVTYKENDYEVVVHDETGTSITDNIDNNAPIMVMNGSVVEYLEIKTIYQDKGVIAKDRDGQEITDITIQYLDNGVEVASINSDEFKTYTINYTAKVNVDGINYTSHLVRTVIVRDTIPPVINVLNTITLTTSQASTYQSDSDVTVSDNSGEIINVSCSDFEREIGDNVITCTAKDSSGNTAIKRRLIKVVED